MSEWKQKCPTSRRLDMKNEDYPWHSDLVRWLPWHSWEARWKMMITPDTVTWYDDYLDTAEKRDSGWGEMRELTPPGWVTRSGVKIIGRTQIWALTPPLSWSPGEEKSVPCRTNICRVKHTHWRIYAVQDIVPCTYALESILSVSRPHKY